MNFIGGADSFRYFKIISVNNKKVTNEGRYKTKGSPGDAAKKAFTQLSKKYKTNKLTFSIKETTQDSPKREHGPYLGEKTKLKKPLEVKYKGKKKPVIIKYETKIHLVKDHKQKGGGLFSSSAPPGTRCSITGVPLTKTTFKHRCFICRFKNKPPNEQFFKGSMANKLKKCGNLRYLQTDDYYDGNPIGYYSCEMKTWMCSSCVRELHIDLDNDNAFVLSNKITKGKSENRGGDDNNNNNNNNIILNINNLPYSLYFFKESKDEYNKLISANKLKSFELNNQNILDEEGFDNLSDNRYVVLLFNSEKELTGRVIIGIGNNNIFEVKRVDLLKKIRGKKLCKKMLSFALKKIKDLGFIHGFIHNASENKINAFFCYLKAGKENEFNVKYQILTEDNQYNMTLSNLFNTNNTNAISKTLKENHHSTLLLYSLDDNFNFIDQ